jgi:hypothetical protein
MVCIRLSHPIGRPGRQEEPVEHAVLDSHNEVCSHRCQRKDLCPSFEKVLYLISLILAHSKSGTIVNDDGVVVSENVGVTKWDIIAIALFSVVTYFTYGLIKASLESGLTPGYTLDIFSINLFS